MADELDPPFKLDRDLVLRLFEDAARAQAELFYVLWKNDGYLFYAEGITEAVRELAGVRDRAKELIDHLQPDIPSETTRLKTSVDYWRWDAVARLEVYLMAYKQPDGESIYGSQAHICANLIAPTLAALGEEITGELTVSDFNREGIIEEAQKTIRGDDE